MPKYYFEDFLSDREDAFGPRTVSEAEILEFARQFDPQPFHTDPDAARESIYGGLIASGWHTCALAMRMMCDSYLLESASMGSPGIDNVRWHRPVRPGDTLRGVRTTVEARASESKPDRGVVVSEWKIYNQSDELVMSMKGMGMFKRRPQ